MPDPVTINPLAPENDGMNYAHLKEEGTQLAQQMSGDVWTDYNESDPGVTILEQLCYALTELSYRAEFPLQDLLLSGHPPTDRIDARRQALFIPRQIFPCNPLTINDYRKLLVDRIPGVANAWLNCRPVSETDGINGLYDIDLYVPSGTASLRADETHSGGVRELTRRVYNQHRNLCEDVDERKIHILKPLPAMLSAEVTIDESQTPEAILAGIFFRLGNFLAPELRREPLKQLLERGESPDRIFNGPLLHNGFINDAQLQPKADKIPIHELTKVIVQSPGVTSASNVTVQVEGKSYHGDQSIPVSPRMILQLITKPVRAGYSIQLRRGGIQLQPNPVRVQRELDKLWASYRCTYQLSDQYQEFFALPRGQHRDLKQYYSVQNQFPNAYGINQYGLPGGSSRLRQAQARQLKGYLLVFDQLLANYFSQLAHAKDLFSIDCKSESTYFGQSLVRDVPDIEPLLVEGRRHYERGLRELVRAQDPFVERRNRFLKVLLALYAEQLDDSSVWITSQQHREERGGEYLIDAKRAMLQQLVRSTANRGRGLDYLARRSPQNTAGMAIKCRIQLGMSALEQQGLIAFLKQNSLKLIRSASDAPVDDSTRIDADVIDRRFLSLNSWLHKRQGRTHERTSGQRPLLRPQTITEDHVRAAAASENYRVGKLSGETEISLACELPKGGWWLVGKYPDDKNVAALIQDAVGYLRHNCRQLYIVEHLLLCHRQSDEQPRHRFGCNFTITAVLSDCPSRGKREGKDYRKFAREVIRQNAPAHLVVNYCFLSPWRMSVFERLNIRWRRALRTGQNIEAVSRRLKEFLQHYGAEQS